MVSLYRSTDPVCAPQVMALRHAVPKNPPGSPGAPRSLIHQPRRLRTPSESTVPQLLIPHHFNSRISNTYKKPQGEGSSSTAKVCQLVTTRSPLRGPHTNSRNPNPLHALLHDSLDTPGVRLTPVLHHSVTALPVVIPRTVESAFSAPPNGCEENPLLPLPPSTLPHAPSPLALTPLSATLTKAIIYLTDFRQELR
jgi:hypothetical protein